MHRTQIYFEEVMFEEIKQRANMIGVSISEYIRSLVQKELKKEPKKQNKADFKQFAGMWEDRDVSLESIREKAWK